MADENDTPTPVDFAGYPSPDELAKGYRASSAEAKRLAEENQRLQQMFQQQQALAANPRQDIPQRSRPEDRLAEFGIPADALNEFVNERVGQALQPLVNGFQARGRVLQEYPDYQKFEADVAQYVNSDPAFAERYNRMFAADPVGAMELALLKFSDTKRKSTPPAPTPNAQQMVDASLPGVQTGETRSGNAGVDSEIDEARRRFEKSGSSADAETYALLRIRQTIPDSHFQRPG